MNRQAQNLCLFNNSFWRQLVLKWDKISPVISRTEKPDDWLRLQIFSETKIFLKKEVSESGLSSDDFPFDRFKIGKINWKCLEKIFLRGIPQKPRSIVESSWATASSHRRPYMVDGQFGNKDGQPELHELIVRKSMDDHRFSWQTVAS